MWVQLVFEQMYDVCIGDCCVDYQFCCFVDLDQQWIGGWFDLYDFVVVFEFLWWYCVVCEMFVQVLMVEQVVWMLWLVVLVEIVGCCCGCELLDVWVDWYCDYVLFELFVVVDVCVVFGCQYVDEIFVGGYFQLDVWICIEKVWYDCG